MGGAEKLSYAKLPETFHRHGILEIRLLTQSSEFRDTLLARSQQLRTPLGQDYKYGIKSVSDRNSHASTCEDADQQQTHSRQYCVLSLGPEDVDRRRTLYIA